MSTKEKAAEYLRSQSSFNLPDVTAENITDEQVSSAIRQKQQEAKVKKGTKPGPTGIVAEAPAAGAGAQAQVKKDTEDGIKQDAERLKGQGRTKWDGGNVQPPGMGANAAYNEKQGFWSEKLPRGGSKVITADGETIYYDPDGSRSTDNVPYQSIPETPAGGKPKPEQVPQATAQAQADTKPAGGMGGTGFSVSATQIAAAQAHASAGATDTMGGGAKPQTQGGNAAQTYKGYVMGRPVHHGGDYVDRNTLSEEEWNTQQAGAGGNFGGLGDGKGASKMGRPGAKKAPAKKELPPKLYRAGVPGGQGKARTKEQLSGAARNAMDRGTSYVREQGSMGEYMNSRGEKKNFDDLSAGARKSILEGRSKLTKVKADAPKKPGAAGAGGAQPTSLFDGFDPNDPNLAQPAGGAPRAGGGQWAGSQADEYQVMTHRPKPQSFPDGSSFEGYGDMFANADAGAGGPMPGLGGAPYPAGGVPGAGGAPGAGAGIMGPDAITAMNSLATALNGVSGGIEIKITEPVEVKLDAGNIVDQIKKVVIEAVKNLAGNAVNGNGKSQLDSVTGKSPTEN